MVICHDRVLDRYGYPGLAVSRLTWKELQQLDLGAWFGKKFVGERMLHLAELFEQFRRRVTYHIEIKEPARGIEESLLRLISDHQVHRQVIVTSFHYDALATIRQLNPEIRMGWLVRKSGLTAVNVARAAAIGCLQICPHLEDLVANRVREAHETLQEVRAHHVVSREDAWRVVNTGCDGLTINHPEWLEHVDGAP